MPYRFLASMMAAVDPALGGLIRLTVTPTGNRVLTLRDFTEPIDCTVDWGDGTSDAVTSNTPVSHTYADEKPRTLTITGKLGGFWNAAARAAGTTFVTSVDAIVSPSLVTLAETFRQCTSLAKLPASVDAPNLAACDRAFLDCRSIASDFPALWMTHTEATHVNAFTRCFLSFWGKLGSGCTSRSYVAAVAAQTYWQKYGTNCSARSYVAGTSGQTYYQKYGTSCSSRSYVSGTASRTYYQAYSNGTSCPSGTKVAAVAAKTYYQQYGANCSGGTKVAAVAAQTYYQKYGNGSTCPAASKVAASGAITCYQQYGSSCPSMYERKRTYYEIYMVGGSGKCPNKKTTLTQMGKCSVCGRTGTAIYPTISGGTYCSVASSKSKVSCKRCNATESISYDGGRCSNNCTAYGTLQKLCNVSSASGVTTCSSACKELYKAASAAYTRCTASSASGVTTCSSSCKRVYQAAQAAYTKCNQSSSSGVTKCGSGCKRVYQAGTAAYTKCGVSSSSGVTTCSSSCKRTYSSGTSSYYKCTASSSSGVSKCSSSCRRTYSSGTSAYYKCTQSSASGVGTCGSGCKRNYTSGQSAYYTCAKGGTCTEASCPWAYANQTACDNAKNAGWA